MNNRSGGRIESEVGRLREVLVHRPGLELQRITPDNKDELLFDELIWLDRARREHDDFAETLRAAGAEPIYVETLLEEVLADADLASEVITTHIGVDLCGRRLAQRARDFLADLSTLDLVQHLIGGVTLGEVGAAKGLVSALRTPEDFLLAPLPNTFFTRDSSLWIGRGLVLCPMNRLVRQRESDLLGLMLQHHPRFADSPVWFDDPTPHVHASFEGGDILVLGARAIAIGISERTTPAGATALLNRLFEKDVIDRAVAVDLPKRRSTMHLDTVMTMVDIGRFVLYPGTGNARTFKITPGGIEGIMAEEAGDLREGLGWALGGDSVDVIEPDLDVVTAAREQWNDAMNTLALAPGEVVSYERNVVTNGLLQEAGVDVTTVPSYELSRGRGGPRCMTCPVLRETL